MSLNVTPTDPSYSAGAEMQPTSSPSSASSSSSTPLTPSQQTLLDEVSQLAKTQHFVPFYNSTDPQTSWLGNFYPTNVSVFGSDFACSEAAYQSQKFPPAIQQEFVGLDGPQAWQLAQNLKAQESPNWSDQMQDVMQQAITAKFNQNPFLKELLLATGSSYLVEHNERVGRDPFWSDNCNGTGANELGQALMQLRGDLGGTGIVPPPPEYQSFISSLT